jgi:hypothetical protein
MPNQTTHLASATLSGHDQLIVELIESADRDAHPTVVAIRWPSKPTVTTAGAFDQVCANAMRLLANASTTLAGIRVWKKL